MKRLRAFYWANQLEVHAWLVVAIMQAAFFLPKLIAS